MRGGVALEVATGKMAAIETRETASRIAAALDELLGISRCSDVADLRSWLHQLACGVGFLGCRYIHLGHGLTGAAREDSPFPVRFLSTSAYDDFGPDGENWVLCDPVVSQIRASFTPFPWTTDLPRDTTPLQARWLVKERMRGVRAGLAVPVQDYVGGPAYLSFFGVDEAIAVQLMEERAPEMAFIAAQFHALAKTLVPTIEGIHDVWLTPREMECLRMAAAGRTNVQCGRELGITENTVEFHLKKVNRKFGVTSKLQAVAIAVSNGIIRV